MFEIGRYNTLKVLRLTPKAAYLHDGSDACEVLLPARLVPRGTCVGDELTVFIYINSEELITATTVEPLAQVGEVAWLKIVSVNDNGAFLHWGLGKDLLLPYSEVPPNLKSQLEPGRSMLVRVFLDQYERIAASARLDNFLENEASGFNEGDKVAVLIDEASDLGQRVIVNHCYWGLVHKSEIFRPLHKGERLDGYIKTLRTDGKLNIALQPPGRGKIDDVAAGILDALDKHEGFLAVSDKSEPELIYQLFGISKKVFKQAIGRLYKERYILIETSGLRRVDKA